MHTTFHKTAPSPLALSTFVRAVVVPAASTPILLSFVDTRFLPVLVADYLAAHLLVYGLIALGLMRWRDVEFGRVTWIPALALAVRCQLVPKIS